MEDNKPLYEPEKESESPDPDEVPITDRSVHTQPYDLVVQSLIDQIKNGTIYLRPMYERPSFQRRYVWTNPLASRLVESILLNVPIPPCYLSQNEEFELDVIDGQQRLFSIYRFLDNQFKLVGLEVLKEFNGCYFHKLPTKARRKIETHTLRCIAITNESNPEIKFDVFERLNTNTVPLNAQELRNCVYRGALNDLLKECVVDKAWLAVLQKKSPDKRMRDEEIVLRFFAFQLEGLHSYRTPMKQWLNDVAKSGRKFSSLRIAELHGMWHNAIDVSLTWFTPAECFRRIDHGRSRAINRALFDLTMYSAVRLSRTEAVAIRDDFRRIYSDLFDSAEFIDLISRAVDHKKRTLRRFELWDQAFRRLLG